MNKRFYLAPSIHIVGIMFLLSIFSTSCDTTTKVSFNFKKFQTSIVMSAFPAEGCTANINKIRLKMVLISSDNTLIVPGTSIRNPAANNEPYQITVPVNPEASDSDTSDPSNLNKDRFTFYITVGNDPTQATQPYSAASVKYVFPTEDIKQDLGLIYLLDNHSTLKGVTDEGMSCVASDPQTVRISASADLIRRLFEMEDRGNWVTVDTFDTSGSAGVKEIIPWTQNQTATDQKIREYDNTKTLYRSPLWEAVVKGATTIAPTQPDLAKWIFLFTDGDANNDGVSVSDAINAAQQQGISVLIAQIKNPCSSLDETSEQTKNLWNLACETDGIHLYTDKPEYLSADNLPYYKALYTQIGWAIQGYWEVVIEVPELADLESAVHQLSGRVEIKMGQSITNASLEDATIYFTIRRP